MSNNKKLNENMAIRDLAEIDNTYNEIMRNFNNIKTYYDRISQREQDWNVSGILPRFTDMDVARRAMDSIQEYKRTIDENLEIYEKDVELISNFLEYVKDKYSIKDEINTVYNNVMVLFRDIYSRGREARRISNV